MIDKAGKARTPGDTQQMVAPGRSVVDTKGIRHGPGSLVKLSLSEAKRLRTLGFITDRAAGASAR